MQLFMSTQAKLKNTKEGHYGDLTFLDSQEKFNITFGSYSTILPGDPTKTDYLSIRKIVRDYADKCKLNICMHLCRLNYVKRFVAK